MTTNYHDAIPSIPPQAANAATVNGPLGQLDANLGIAYATADSALSFAVNNNAELVAARSPYPSLDARLDALVMAGGNVATKANGVSAAGQKVLTVDATTGFIVGAYVTYLLNGTTLEGNTIASIQAGVSLTLGTNIGAGGVLDDSYISMISISEYQAAQAIPHAGTLMLPQTMDYINAGKINVRAFGASPSAAASVNGAAIRAAMTKAASVKGTVVIDDWLEVDDVITVKSNVTVEGTGYNSGVWVDTLALTPIPAEELVGDTTVSAILYTEAGATGVVFRNLRVKGKHVYDGASGITFNILLGIGSTNCIVENCWSDNAGWSGIMVRGSGHLITGNSTYECAVDGIEVWGRDVRIIGNRCERNGYFTSKVYPLGGIEVAATESIAGTDIGITISDNIIVDCYGGISCTGTEPVDVIISGNHVSSTDLSALNVEVGSATPPSSFVVTGNVFRDSTYNIHVCRFSNVVGSVIFSGNSMLYNAVGNALSFEGCTGGTVVNGNVFLQNRVGLAVAADSANMLVTGNYFGNTAADVVNAGPASVRLLHNYYGSLFRSEAYAAFLGAATTSVAATLRVDGESQGRFVQFADGKMEWGDGTNARDTALYRNAANELKTDDALTVALELKAEGAFNHDGATVGFYGVAPTARLLLATGVGATVDNVITALQTLGLVKQA